MSENCPPASAPARIAIIGLGKIARDAHLPAIMASPAFDLVATIDPANRLDGYRSFCSAEELFRSDLAVDAVAICTPPAVRAPIAAGALECGLATMLEKPPAATLAEAEALRQLALRRKVGLFAAWHSREAPGVAAALSAVAGQAIIGGKVTWREDVRQWHPGQDWIFERSGFGVFDPAINAISIITRIDPTISVDRAALFIPRGRTMPVRARADLRSGTGGRICCEFDFLWQGQPNWTIELATPSSAIRLGDGGHSLALDGQRAVLYERDEYGALYRKFADIVTGKRIDCCLSALRIVEDCLRLGERFAVPAFDF